MSRIEDLADITAVIYRYSTAMDARQWELMDDVFTEEATSTLGGSLFPRGRRQVVGLIRAAIECCSVTHHMNSNIEAMIVGDGARVTSLFRAWHLGTGKRAHLTYEALGGYKDDFVRTPRGWRIRHREEYTVANIGDQREFFADAARAFAEVSKA